MIPIKESKLRVAIMPRVGRVAGLRIALEAKTIRKKIAMERKVTPRIEPAGSVCVEE